MKKKDVIYLGFVCFFFIVSCATPPPEKSPTQWISVLPEESSVYICINKLDEIRPLVTAFLPLFKLNLPDIQSVLKDTDELYAAITIDKATSPLFSLALIGHYSSFCIGTGLNIHRKWKKDPKTMSYWKHSESGTMIALIKGSVLLITNDSVVSFIEKVSHPDVRNFYENIHFSPDHFPATIVFPQFGEEVIPERIPINKKKLPVKEVIISTQTKPGFYTFSVSLDLVSPDNARLFTTTFKTFIIWLMRNAKIDTFIQRVKVDTENRIVKTIISDLTNEEIVRIVEVLIDFNGSSF